MNLNQITLPALDIAASVAFYKRLGCTLLVETVDYARFKAPGGEVTLSVHLVHEISNPPQTVVYFECGVLDLRVAELRALGVQFTQEPRDAPWLWREARLLDPSGNPICLYHAGDNRINPPWRVGGQQPAGLVPLQLETPRLLLRPPQERDLEDVLDIHRDDDVTRYLPYPSWTSMEQAVSWYHRMHDGMAQGKVSYMVIVDKASGRVAGSTLLRDWDAEARKVEIGYMLGRPYWGRGLAREAVAAVMDAAFQSLELRRMEAQIDARNLASQRLVESLGFQREALLRDNWCDKGEVSDSTIYGLLRREWFTREENLPPGRPKAN